MQRSHASNGFKLWLSRRAAVSTAALLLSLCLGTTLVGCRSAPRERDKPTTKPSARHATLTPEQRQKNLESFDYVWNTIQRRHWDPTLGGLDWNAVRDELRPKVEDARTTAAARGVMQDMIERLKQSHFGIIPASVYDDIEASRSGDADEKENGVGTTKPANRRGVIGADVRLVEGRAVVTKVDPQLAAAGAGVRPGWEVVLVDGRKMSELIARLRKNLPDNSMRRPMLTMALNAALHGRPGETTAITFRDGRGRRVTRELEFQRPSGTEAIFGNLPPMYVDFESRRLEPNVGYIAFKPFFDPPMIFQRFAEAMGEFGEADGIILDLRGNIGGIGGMAMGIGSWFITEPNQQLGTMTSREGSINFVLNPRPSAYEGPLAVLVDEASMSTSEILAGGLQDLGRARVFGVATPGAALPSVVERLPNGDGFQYAFANYTSAGGEALEGRGVIPDQEVKLTRRALLRGRDPVIDAAVEWVKTQSPAPAEQQMSN